MKHTMLLLAFIIAAMLDPVRSAAALKCAANQTGQVIPTYEPCGGLGSGCNLMKNTKCSDTPWINYCCAAGSICTRKTQYYYKCDVPVVAQVSVPCTKYTGPPCATKAPLYGACGGIGSNCTGCQCRDAPWPGVCCPSTATCTRQDKYYYKCVPKPGTDGAPAAGPGVAPVTAATCKPPAVKVVRAYEPCGGLGSDCDPCQCADAPWKYTKCPAGFKCNRKTQWYYKCEAV